jgi:predicted AAA+ superfamily ATPase
MPERPFWKQAIEDAWTRKPVVWLRGVRRVGKTTLAQSLPRTRYFDCELPGVRRRIENPESFLRHCRGARIVLDEVHRLPNPSEILKIAADHFPETRVLATGSSTLGASARFRDTLAGRKADVYLTPMIARDLASFGRPDLEHRMLRGGLPLFFLAPAVPERDFQEWMDAYWAKDILELFRLERRAAFQRLFELVLVRSGGIFDASRFARDCGVSRTTIANYLSVLEATSVAHVVRPYSEGGSAELVAAPRVYGFAYLDPVGGHAPRNKAADQGAAHVPAADERCCDVHCERDYPRSWPGDGVSRGPNIAVPIRTSVEPSAMAASKSALLPIDSVSSPWPCSMR